MQQTLAIGYSAVSGSGKTRSMLELSDCYYIGGNCDMMFSGDELSYASKGRDHMKRILMRRILLAFVFKEKLVSRKFPTEKVKFTLPKFVNYLYDNRVLFDHKTAIQIFCEKLNQQQIEKKFFFLGLDELQLFRRNLPADCEKQKDKIEQLAVSCLREIQLECFTVGQVERPIVIPVTTGIIPNFDQYLTHGKNVILHQKDSVILYPRDFFQLVKSILTFDPNDLAQQLSTLRMNETGTELKFNNSVRDLLRTHGEDVISKAVTILFWPRIREFFWTFLIVNKDSCKAKTKVGSISC